jgi:hypothetical protein
MEGLILILGLTFVVAVVDVLALRFGADSRPGIGDDHARPLSL